MKIIEIDEITYELINKEAAKFNKDISVYLKELMIEITEIIPTAEEKKEWRDNLYNTCKLLATERDNLEPSEEDDIETLLETFFYWASEYNDGYFSERDNADTDRYCAWLVQEYEKYC